MPGSGFGAGSASKRKTRGTLVELFVFTKGETGTTGVEALPFRCGFGAPGQQLTTAATRAGERRVTVALIFDHIGRNHPLRHGLGASETLSG